MKVGLQNKTASSDFLTFLPCFLSTAVVLWASALPLVLSAAVTPSDATTIAPVFSLNNHAPSTFLRRAGLATHETYPPPTSDPFYAPPSDYHRKPNGAVLKSRNVTTAFDYLATTWQVLYKTTDAQGKADSTVTTLFRPHNPVSPPKVMLYFAPTNTARLDCETSFALLSPTFSDTSLVNIIDLSIALQKGWYVSVPDHEGSKSAFLSGVTEARAGLDGLRAMLAFDGLKEELKEYDAVIRGYSGGGHEAAWATQYLSTYAKELKVAGAAAGGVPVDLYYTFDLVSGTPDVYLALTGLAGLANAEPSLQRWLNSHTTPEGLAAVAYAQNSLACLDSIASADKPFPSDLYSYFEGGEESIRTGVFYEVFEKNRLGRKMKDGNKGVLPIPMFLHHSKTDGDASYAPIRPYWRSQCAHGAKIHLATTTGQTHVGAYLGYLADSYVFLQKAFDGTLGLDECKATDGVEYELLSANYTAIIGDIASKRVSDFVEETSG
ncbi:hypothetical protein JCM11641_000013 [Rhodosporidiobolus odoratus]